MNFRSLMIQFIFIIKHLFGQKYTDINGNFKMCTVNSNINMLNIQSDCFSKNRSNKKTIGLSNLQSVTEAYVFSKHNFVLETMGTECKMLVKKYRFSRDLFFNKFVQNDFELIQLSKQDCKKMLIEKKCGDFRESFEMKCTTNNRTCLFNQDIVEEFPFYFGTIEKRFVECHLSEKIVMAQNSFQNVFQNSNKPCLAADGICFMPQSTIIWNTNEIRKCPYERLIHVDDFYFESRYDDTIIISQRQNYLFKLVEKVNECDIDFYSTSEGLYLSFHNGQSNLKKKLEQLPISKYDLNHFTDRDKNDLILTEQDYENNRLLDLIKKLQCSMMINSIKQSLHLDDTFLNLNNLGNMLYF